MWETGDMVPRKALRPVVALWVLVGLMLAATPAWANGQSAVAEARQATAEYHQVSHAEAAGYGSTLDGLGCFENPGVGGMGVHYVNETFLLDGEAVADEPEALVYEMRPNGKLQLVALEYLVPIAEERPTLFGQQFHPHPSPLIPFWILHVWIWKPNPDGMFENWNPRVGDCPDGVPVFDPDPS